MLEILSLKPESFGLDISDLSLKIVKLERKWGKLGLASFGEIAIPKGIIRRGTIKKEEQLIILIKKVITEAKGKKINTKYVIVSLPEEKAFLEVIKMPHLSLKELKSAVIYEAENYIPLPVEDVYLDSQVLLPIDEKSEQQDVLIAALPRRTIDPYVNCLKRAGLKPVAFEIESMAVARAVIKNEFTTRPILIIDLGATKTSFIIFSGSSLNFTFYNPISSQKLTNIIAQEMQVDIVKAEKLKTKYGLKAKAVFDNLSPCLNDLVNQINKYLDYYKTHVSEKHLGADRKKLEKVLLCGGGANLKGLTDFLSIHLNLPVELANPWINILPADKKEIPRLTLEQSLSYTSALGLSLRDIKND